MATLDPATAASVKSRDGPAHSPAVGSAAPGAWSDEEYLGYWIGTDLVVGVVSPVNPDRNLGENETHTVRRPAAV